jgi:hypothetical protein
LPDPPRAHERARRDDPRVCDVVGCEGHVAVRCFLSVEEARERHVPEWKLCVDHYRRRYRLERHEEILIERLEGWPLEPAHRR